MPTQEQIERSNIEACFGLTGGELGSEPFGPHRYWYEGCPEWCTGTDGNYTEEQSMWGRYRTIVAIVVGEKPDASDIPEGWRFVALYRSCSEVDCDACGGQSDDEEDHDLVGPTHEHGDESEAEPCPYCEGGGVQWLGDEWAEIVVEQPQYESAYDGQWLGSIELPVQLHSYDGRADVWRIEHEGETVWSFVWGDGVECELLMPDRAISPAMYDASPWFQAARERSLLVAKVPSTTD